MSADTRPAMGRAAADTEPDAQSDAPAVSGTGSAARTSHRRRWPTDGHMVAAVPAGVALGLAGRQGGLAGLIAALVAVAVLVVVAELVRTRMRTTRAARERVREPGRDTELLSAFSQLCQSQGRVAGPRRAARELGIDKADAARLLALLEAIRQQRAEQRELEGGASDGRDSTA
ncbi:MAG: hypothetical protein GEV09_11045 [Pseudonocardiaceae bacterium]|nr:hypothetical protein [Pseudonocardiaceae bacterium]